MPSSRLFRGVVLAMAGLVLASASTAQLSGAYTIDPAGSGPKNYTTFASASSALSSQGVNGPVVFRVASTTFNESVTFNAAAGTSSTNTVTIIAAGAPATIKATGGRGLSLMGGVRYFTFENLMIQNATSDGLYLSSATAGRVEFCTFKNITVDMPATNTTSISAIESQQARDLTFLDCTFQGGGYTFYSQGMYRGAFDRCVFDGKGKANRVVTPWNANDSDCIFTNCTVKGAGPAGYGLWVDYSGYGIMFWHNTIQPHIIIGT